MASEKVPYGHRELISVLCDTREGEMQWGVGEIQEGGDKCVLVADAHCRVPLFPCQGGDTVCEDSTC